MNERQKIPKPPRTRNYKKPTFAKEAIERIQGLWTVFVLRPAPKKSNKITRPSYVTTHTGFSNMSNRIWTQTKQKYCKKTAITAIWRLHRISTTKSSINFKVSTYRYFYMCVYTGKLVLGCKIIKQNTFQLLLENRVWEIKININKV